jgi:hypothetical protein
VAIPPPSAPWLALCLMKVDIGRGPCRQAGGQGQFSLENVVLGVSEPDGLEVLE